MGKINKYTREFLIELLSSSVQSVLKGLNKEDIDDLLTNRDSSGNTIGQIIAWKHDKQTMLNFFHLVEEKAEELFPEIITQAAKDNWTIGHVIARYQTPDALAHFLNLVVTHAPESLPLVLRQVNKDNWTIGHAIALYQTPDALAHFLNLVVTYAPESLPQILTTKSSNTDEDMIDAILSKHKNAGEIVFQLLTCHLGLSRSITNRLAPMKEALVKHIATLPLDNRIEVLKNSQDKTHPLGAFFYIKRGFFAPREGRGTLAVLEKRLKEALETKKHILSCQQQYAPLYPCLSNEAQPIQQLTSLEPVYQAVNKQKSVVPIRARPMPIEQPLPTNLLRTNSFFRPGREESYASPLTTQAFQHLMDQAPNMYELQEINRPAETKDKSSQAMLG